MADARWLRAKGAAENSPDLIRLSMQLATSARQAERDAWELASREATARPKTPGQFPWLLPNKGPSK
jgi:hypothetical protein